MLSTVSQCHSAVHRAVHSVPGVVSLEEFHTAVEAAAPVKSLEAGGEVGKGRFCCRFMFASVCFALAGWVHVKVYACSLRLRRILTRTCAGNGSLSATPL